MKMRTISQIVFDLETIPGENKPGPADIKVPANYKDPVKIEAFRNNKTTLDDAWKKQALSYIDGRIHSIGFKIGTDPTGVVFSGTDEQSVLKLFELEVIKSFNNHYQNDTIYSTTWIGHNIKTFDLPYLWLRARKYKCDRLLQVLGVMPDNIKFLDTMMVACVTDKYKGMVSLDKACVMFGLPGKGDVSGKDVFDMWQAGKDQEIADYCVDDVQKTHDLGQALGMILPDDEE